MSTQIRTRVGSSWAGIGFGFLHLIGERGAFLPNFLEFTEDLIDRTANNRERDSPRRIPIA
jgi:hypothetical protein